MLDQRKSTGLLSLSLWGGRGIVVKIEDRFDLNSGPQNDQSYLFLKICGSVW